MTTEQIRNAYNAVPFKPFVIHIADGREIPVMHRLLFVTDLEFKTPANGSCKGKKRKA
jgi:hypothetical protein